jgi:hypothetical protein
MVLPQSATDRLRRFGIYLWLKNAMPTAASTINATSRATANGIKTTS